MPALEDKYASNGYTPGNYAPTWYNGGAALQTTLKKRAKSTTVAPPALPPLPPAPAAPVDTAGSVAASQQRLAEQQQALQDALQAADLDALINRLTASRQSGLADFNSQLGDISRNSEFARGQAQKNIATAGSVGRRLLSERGVGLGGIRLGAESRNASQLSDALGAIGLQEGQQSDAIRRAIEDLNNQTDLQIAGAQAKKKALFG